MRKPILTPLRKSKLADYCLNISVVSFAVAAFEHNWLGFVTGILGLIVFFILTRE